MSQSQSMRRLSLLLRRYPWIVRLARHVYGVTRPRFTMGAVGVIFNAQGRVLMVEHVFHPYLPWGLPGGWVDRNETPGDAVIRELREELQVNATLGEVVAVNSIERGHIDVAFLCSTTDSIGTLSFELLGYQWADPNALPPTHDFHRLAIARAQALFSVDLRT